MYVALSWTPQTEAAGAAARHSQRLQASGGWRRALSAPGLEIWTATTGPALLVVQPVSGLALIGRIWRRGEIEPAAPALFAALEGAERRARALVERCWGAYVAVLVEPNHDAWVLRDPSGAVEVLTWERDGVGIAASDLEDLPPGLAPARIGLDWDVVSDLVRRQGAIAGRLALHGVVALAPGEMQRMGGGAVQCLWSPRTFARQAEGQAPSEAEVHLRRAVDLAVAGATSPYRRCLFEVSGGFDSAVVTTTAAAGAAGHRILHLQGDRPEADERPWATAVAEATGWPMSILRLGAAPFDEADLSVLARGARPVINAPDPLRDRGALRIAHDLGVEAVVTGKGGDAVFFQHPTADILADQLAAQGGAALCGPLAQGLARRLRRSVWSVGLEAVRSQRRSRPEPDSPLFGPRLRGMTPGPMHPWLADVGDLPPGKRAQLSALVVTQLQRGRTRLARAITLEHPLLSQPALEAALAIPVWRLAQDGRERGLARDAFAARLPALVQERRSKGELSALVARQVALNLPLLRPWLLDGCLCAAGVLDRGRLDSALAEDALIRGGDPSLILRAAAIEAFVRHWQTRIPDWTGAPRARGRLD